MPQRWFNKLKIYINVWKCSEEIGIFSTIELFSIKNISYIDEEQIYVIGYVK